MGSPLGLPMASLSVCSGGLDEADRPGPKDVIKTKAKKSNLPFPLHPESFPRFPLPYTRFNPSCQPISSLYLLLLSDSMGKTNLKNPTFSILDPKVSS
jgi:hypothetical protein